MKYFPKSETAQTYYIMHTQKKKKEKQEAFMKENPLKTVHLPYKWFSQSRFSL